MENGSDYKDQFINLLSNSGALFLSYLDFLGHHYWHCFWETNPKAIGIFQKLAFGISRSFDATILFDSFTHI